MESRKMAADEPVCRARIERLKCKQNGHGKGKGRAGCIGRLGVTYIHSRVVDSVYEPMLKHRKLKPVYCDDLE